MGRASGGRGTTGVSPRAGRMRFGFALGRGGNLDRMRCGASG
jgi:hypothetical protein